MKTHSINGIEYGLIDVPKGSNDFSLNIHGNRLVYNDPDEYDEIEIALPPGEWQLIGLSSELTEEVAATIMGERLMNPNTALKVLIQSLGMSDSCLILKRVK